MTGSGPESGDTSAARAHRQLALVTGLPDALRILRGWSRRPVRVLLPWLVVSSLVALVLLGLVWLVGSLVPADPTKPWVLPGRAPRDTAAAMQHVTQRNLAVLALHATACLAGFIVYFATRDPREDDEGALEQVTRLTARVAFWFVPTATIFSIATQAWVLGSFASTAAAHLQMSVGALLRTTLWHAIPELAAVFLPLAAWLVALHRRRVAELYAATIASVLVALPMIMGAAWIEVHRWDERVRAAPRDFTALEEVMVGTMVGDEGARAVDVRLESVLDAPPAQELSIVREQVHGRVDDGAIAIVAAGDVLVPFRVGVREAGGPCGGGQGAFEAHDLEGFDELAFVRQNRAIPGMVTEFTVVEILGKRGTIDPRRQQAGYVLQALAQERCEGSEQGG